MSLLHFSKAGVSSTERKLKYILGGNYENKKTCTVAMPDDAV